MRAVPADDAVAPASPPCAAGCAAPSTLDALRAGHERSRCRAPARGPRAPDGAALEVVADERRADLVSASQDREAIAQLRVRALERHRVEELRLEGVAMDELAMRRARARVGAAA